MQESLYFDGSDYFPYGFKFTPIITEPDEEKENMSNNGDDNFEEDRQGSKSRKRIDKIDVALKNSAPDEINKNNQEYQSNEGMLNE